MTEDMESMEQIIQSRIARLHEVAPGAIGDRLQFQLVSCDAQQGRYLLRCSTHDWMRNTIGTLHGGMSAVIADQAMSIIGGCVKPGDGAFPAISLNVSYHRPLVAGKDVLASVEVVSLTKSLLSLRCELSSGALRDRVCVSCTGTYFLK